MSTAMPDPVRRPGNPSWVKGVSGNPQGRPSRAEREARIDGIVAQWCLPFGGTDRIPPANITLLRAAAELSLRRPSRIEDVTRVSNTISKLMQQSGLVSSREPPFEQVEDQR
jgi:hypothetical protein